MRQRVIGALMAALASLLPAGAAPAEEAGPIRTWTAPPFWTGPVGGPSGNPDARDASQANGGRAAEGRQALVGGPAALPFIAVFPCRLVDTRAPSFPAPLGGGFLPPAIVRSYTLTGLCNIPPTAQAISLNVTVVHPTGPGFITLYPEGGTFPPVSTLNYLGNDVIVNAAVVPLSVSGGISMALGVSGGDVILDTNGYYAPQTAVTSLNALSGDLSLVAGSPNVTITPGAGSVSIAATSGLTSVAHDVTLTGNGAGTPLGVQVPLFLTNGNPSFYALGATSSDASGFAAIYGRSGPTGVAVHSTGVLGSGNTGVMGFAMIPAGNGVVGETGSGGSATGAGVWGKTSGTGPAVRGTGAFAGLFEGNVQITGNASLGGSLGLPPTNPALTVGAIILDGSRFLHGLGTRNTFLGSGAGNPAMTVASSTDNTAVGFAALQSATTGDSNAAFGAGALASNTQGDWNAAFGQDALSHNLDGGQNAAFGKEALFSNQTAGNNAAFGSRALKALATSGSNTAIGAGALTALTSGATNTAIGAQAGGNLLSGNFNIYVGHQGVANESGVLRIGSAFQTSTYIAGVYGANQGGSGIAVFVASDGRLGTVSSSRRYKEHIVEIADESDLLMRLRPVSFLYKPEYDPSRTPQYGLIAEEVAEVAPQLAVFDEEGRPETVRYHFVNAMLLNEVQKSRRLIDELRADRADLVRRLEALERRSAGQADAR